MIYLSTEPQEQDLQSMIKAAGGALYIFTNLARAPHRRC